MKSEGNELPSVELTDYCPTTGEKEEEVTGEWCGRRGGLKPSGGDAIVYQEGKKHKRT